MSMLTKNETKSLTYLQRYFLWPIITLLYGNDFSHYWPHPPIAAFVYSSWASFWTNSQVAHKLACHDAHVMQLSVVRIIEVFKLARMAYCRSKFKSIGAALKYSSNFIKSKGFTLNEITTVLKCRPDALELNPEQQIPCELGQGWS